MISKGRVGHLRSYPWKVFMIYYEDHFYPMQFHRHASHVETCPSDPDFWLPAGVCVVAGPAGVEDCSKVQSLQAAPKKCEHLHCGSSKDWCLSNDMLRDPNNKTYRRNRYNFQYRYKIHFPNFYTLFVWFQDDGRNQLRDCSSTEILQQLKKDEIELTRHPGFSRVVIDTLDRWYIGVCQICRTTFTS